VTVDDWARLLGEGDCADELARALRSDEALVSARTSLGNTLLHEACWTKRVASARVLLDAGADPNARGEHGRTPLHCAVHDAPMAQVAPLVQLLVERRADPTLADETGTTVPEDARKEIWDHPNEPALPADPESAVRAIETRAHTAVAMMRVLEAFRDEHGAPDLADLPAADRRCIADLISILDAVSQTSWASAARDVLAVGLLPAHVERLLDRYGLAVRT